MVRRRGREFEKCVCLALQGGGAHGAFTWGVLDRLLEDNRLFVSAISGTSAGALNAVVMAEGLMRGGEDGAREALEKFWRAVSEAAHTSPIRRSPLDILMGNWSLDHSPSYLFFDMLTRVIGPYQYNPLSVNPLRDIVDRCINFEQVRENQHIELFISATNVETGRVRVFRREELTTDIVMASACLPFLFHAVEIDGAPYWDGGFMGNPVLFPFHAIDDTRDIVIVQINPVRRAGTPTTAPEILNRLNEITFNSSLLKELRMLDFINRMVDRGALDETKFSRFLLHIIENEERLKPLGASSKLNAEWRFLTHLRDIGRETADQWLARNYDALGQRSSCDTRDMFRSSDPLDRY